MSPRLLGLFLRIAQWGLVIAFTTQFLVLDGSAIFPFIVGKFFFFRAAVELILIFIIPIWISSPQFRPSKKLLLLVGVYAIALLGATLFGVDAHRSFWSIHERMTGTYSLLHFGVFALMLASVFRGWECEQFPNTQGRAIGHVHGWKWFLRAVAIVGAAQALIAIAQRINGNLFLSGPPGGRVWGTMGNYLYLAGAMVFHFYLLFLLWAREKNSAWRKLYIGTSALYFFGFLFANSRGATVAFTASFIVFLVVYRVGAGAKARRALWGMLGGIAVMLVLVYALRDNPVLQKIPYVSTLASVRLTGTAETRFLAWKVAAEAWKDHQAFGWGVENFYYAFNAHYNPESLTHGIYETWFDNAHSMYFNTLATMGIVGLGAYLALMVVPLVWVFRAWKKGIADVPFFSVATALMVLYAVQSVFVFDHFGSYLLFYVLLALIAIATERKEESPLRIQSPRWLFTVSAFGAVVLFVLIFRTNLQPWQANHASYTARQSSREGIEKAGLAFARALKMPTPHRSDIAFDFTQFIFESAGSGAPVPPEMIQSAILALEQVQRAHPREVLAYSYQAQLYVLKGSMDENFTAAEEAMKKAVAFSPKRQELYFIWARIRAARGDHAGALELYQKAVSFDPTVGQSHFYYAVALARAGKKEEAAPEMLAAVQSRFKPASKNEAAIAVDILFAGGHFIESWEYFYWALTDFGGDNDPQQLARLFDFAVRVGDMARAHALEAKMLLLMPEAKAELERVRAQIEKEKSAGAP